MANGGDMVGSLLTEMDLRTNYLESRELDSIYFGGGTPSILRAKQLEAIFENLHKNFNWRSTCEITLEANPDDITPENLFLWKRMGINRLSIGLQSFNNAELKWMNRAHTAEESFKCVKMAQDAGFDNISIDLIYGSKFQTLSDWHKTLDTAIALNTSHISSYNLTIESKTALGVNYKRGKEPGVNEDLSSKQFLLMIEKFSNAGFLHYEISNFAKPDFLAVHNSNYWLQKPYLGIGPSAHSFNGKSRQWNVKNNSLYIKALNEGGTYFEKEELSTRDAYNEYVLTRLRTIWGCDVKEIEKKFGEKFLSYFKNGCEEKREFLIETNGVYTLNESGKLQADGIASDLFFL